MVALTAGRHRNFVRDFRYSRDQRVARVWKFAGSAIRRRQRNACFDL